jgi:class 3 adenylate cyclase/tetratricopeptide (TPR) repeat protein
MQCSRCQTENKDDRRFCAACGAALLAVCAACGFSNEAGAAFCGGCGVALSRGAAPVTGSTAPAPTPAPPAPRPLPSRPAYQSPRAYTPAHLAERILGGRSALEGERKQVTVMFADLKGSMEVLAERDPEEARQILDPVLEAMMDAVHRYQGTVNQVMGDGIMALFGAPVAHEDHAVRAGYAALRMAESIAALAAEHERRFGFRAQIRVGMNSGEVVVRTIGSDLRMDYSAVGQTTHLAARMEQLAGPGSIFVTEAFTRLTESSLHFKPLGLVTVKGLPEPVDVFELVGAEPTRTRFQAAASRGLTRFVGRADELKMLQDALERAEARAGQVVAVIGEPGVGKSRLFHELVRSSQTQGWLVLETGSVSYGQKTAWMPVADLLRTYFQIDERADPADMREQVTARLVALDPSLADTLPALLWLLDLPVDDPVWAGLDPEQRRQVTMDAVRRVLVWQSRVRPLLLIFENLHWIDAETQTFLNRLVDGLRGTRILLLVSYRPEYRHGWASRTYYNQVRLDPLTPQSAEELLETLLGRASDLVPLKALLIERTQGNPFFLEESVRTLVETKIVVGQRGAFHLARPLSSIRVPATVQTMLAARIDRLSAEEKKLLQTAAVIGREFSLPLLEASMRPEGGDLGTGIARLQSAEFLYESSLFPEIEYTFKHVLTQEVAYDSLLIDRRRALHARILETIEGFSADRLASEAEHLAHHAFRGEVWDKAARYMRQAGTRSLARSASREAAAFFEQALVALEHLPADHPRMEEAIDVRLDLRQALVPLAERRRILDQMQKAEAMARTLGDQRRLSWIAYALAHYHYLSNDQEETVKAGHRALELSGGTDVAHGVAVNLLLGYSFHMTGDYPQAVAVLRRNVDVLSGDRVRERFGLPIFPTYPSVTSRERLVRCLGELGEFDEAMRLGEEALRLAEELDHAPSFTAICLGLGMLLMRREALDRAMPILERGMDVGRRGSIYLYVFSLIGAVGRVRALTGRLEEGIGMMTEVVEEAASKNSPLGQAVRLGWLAEGHLVAGDLPRAWQRAQESLEFARRFHEKGQEVWALHLLGDVAARREPADLDTPARLYEEAMTLGAKLQMRPALAHCRLGLGELHARAGRHDLAEPHLAAAVALFGEMGIPSLRDRAARQRLRPE